MRHEEARRRQRHVHSELFSLTRPFVTIYFAHGWIFKPICLFSCCPVKHVRAPSSFPVSFSPSARSSPSFHFHFLRLVFQLLVSGTVSLLAVWSCFSTSRKHLFTPKRVDFSRTRCFSSVGVVRSPEIIFLLIIDLSLGLIACRCDFLVDPLRGLTSLVVVVVDSSVNNNASIRRTHD
jgi:hypothetical protein